MAPLVVANHYSGGGSSPIRSDASGNGGPSWARQAAVVVVQ